MTDNAFFHHVDRILDHVLDVPKDARHDHVRDACDGDEDLFKAVMAMLDAIEASGGFMENDAIDNATPIPPPRLGAWLPERLIGKGGMGEVWLARRCDGQFEQQVAIKLLPGSCQPSDVERFMAEQKTLARLEHPGIARLLDAGRAPDGRPYMVMEYVQGQDIVRHCQTHALSLSQRLALFRQACAAVAFAHTHLVVHRDLKPHNILVTRNERVVLLDFGIARLIDSASASVRSDTVVQLTPHYAAPEQLANEPQSTLTDVYGLGLLLYEMLAGRAPWQELGGGSQLVLLQRMLAGAPALPSSATCGAVPRRVLRGDLDAIVTKALRPEPAARYASVQALDDDIGRYLEHEPVAARGDAFTYQLRRTLRRYWLAASLVVAIVSGMAIALAAVSSARQQAERERDSARVEATRSKAIRDYLGHMFRDASQHQAAGRPLTAKQVLDQAAGRIGNAFASDPATAAQIMHELGELHLYIDDYVGAEPLLRGWLEMEHSVGDATAAASVRFALAETVFRMGQVDEAKTLLDQAQAYWLADRQRHEFELLTSRMLESQLQRRMGDPQAAIATLEAAATDCIQRCGTDSFHTAALHTNLGAAYLETGELQKGIDLSRKALALWEQIDLGAGNDALNTLNNLAAGYYRAGELAEAEHWFERAVAVRRDAFGPSAATAALLNNYGRVLLQTGRLAQASVLAGEAVSMASEYSGSNSPLTLSARLLDAEVHLANKPPTDLRATLRQLHADIEEQLGADHLLTARVLLTQAHHDATLGERITAAERLALARQRLTALAAQGAPFLPHADRVQALIDAL